MLYSQFAQDSENHEAMGDYGRNEKDFPLLEEYIKNWGAANSYSHNDIHALTEYIMNTVIAKPN